jgi:hypothetical protein
MTSQLPCCVPPADGDGHGGGESHDRHHDGLMIPGADLRAARYLIAMMLLAAAALDLTRCGIVVATARHAGPATGLVSAGLAAAALSLCATRGYRGGRRWSGWAALLIGAASGPQAAMSGFHVPYTIPDTATAGLGVLLTVAVLATAGRAGRPAEGAESPCTIDRVLTR